MGRRHFTSSVILGFLLGLGITLYIAWALAPVDFSNADPADLRNLHKDDILRMIAAEYMLDGDFALAQRQMTALHISDVNARVLNLATAEAQSPAKQALNRLYLHLQNPALAQAVPNTVTPRSGNVTVTPIRLTPTRTRTVTPTFVIPTRTVTPVRPTLEPTLVPPTVFPNPNAPLFKLTAQERLTCRETDAAVIQVIVRDANGNELPGIAVEVAWETGHENFYTGLQPERGIGFADYSAEPRIYSVRLMENARSEIVKDLQIHPAPTDCANSDNTRGWKLTFTKV